MCASCWRAPQHRPIFGANYRNRQEITALLRISLRKIAWWGFNKIKAANSLSCDRRYSRNFVLSLLIYVQTVFWHIQCPFIPFAQLVEPGDKLRALITFLRSHASTEKILVFLATCASVDYFARLLKNGLLPQSQVPLVHAIHRKMRNKRISEFGKFRTAER